MKALVVAEQLRRRVPGGVGTYVRGLSTGLKANTTTETTLWASKSMGAPDAVGELGLAVVNAWLPSKVLTRAWDRGFSSPPSGFDVVHATSFAIPPKSPTPMTAMIHDIAWRRFPEAYPDRGRRWHEASLSRAVERSRILVTPAQQTADDLVAAGVDAGRVVVIPEGCDHLPERDGAAVAVKLTSLGVEGEFLLAVGTLEPRKNLNRLFAAYEAADTTLPLLVAGPAGWGEMHKPPNGVLALGAVEPALLSGLYANCRAFISVPLLEGFGLPVVEAMYAGAPVISSAVPAAGDASYEVDPTDVGAIAKAIDLVVRDDDVRKELIAKGEAHTAAMTWERCAQAHVEVWESLL